MSQRAEETLEFAVGERPALVVKNPAGSVTVTAGEAGRIGVQVTKTLRGVTGFEVALLKGKVENGKVTEYRVTPEVTFILE